MTEEMLQVKNSRPAQAQTKSTILSLTTTKIFGIKFSLHNMTDHVETLNPTFLCKNIYHVKTATVLEILKNM